MDDSTVKVTSINKVLSQQAYILFYAREPRLDTVVLPSTVPETINDDSLDQARTTQPQMVTSLMNDCIVETMKHEDSHSDASVEENNIHLERKTRLRRMLSWCLLPMT